MKVEKSLGIIVISSRTQLEMCCIVNAQQVEVCLPWPQLIRYFFVVARATWCTKLKKRRLKFWTTACFTVLCCSIVLAFLLFSSCLFLLFFKLWFLFLATLGALNRTKDACSLLSIRSVNFVKYLSARAIYFSDTTISIVNFNCRFSEQILLWILTSFSSKGQGVEWNNLILVCIDRKSVV